MSKITEVEAVIAALKSVLKDAETQRCSHYYPRTANRWIDRLPGSWRGKGSLKVAPRGEWIAYADFVSQVRATIAYLETNKEVIANGSGASWLRFWRRKPKEAPVSLEPIDVEFSEAPMPGRKQRNALKVVDKP